jgi:hypothetical protein
MVKKSITTNTIKSASEFLADTFIANLGFYLVIIYYRVFLFFIRITLHTVGSTQRRFFIRYRYCNFKLTGGQFNRMKLIYINCVRIQSFYYSVLRVRSSFQTFQTPMNPVECIHLASQKRLLSPFSLPVEN